MTESILPTSTYGRALCSAWFTMLLGTACGGPQRDGDATAAGGASSGVGAKGSVESSMVGGSGSHTEGSGAGGQAPGSSTSSRRNSSAPPDPSKGGNTSEPATTSGDQAAGGAATSGTGRRTNGGMGGAVKSTVTGSGGTRVAAGGTTVTSGGAGRSSLANPTRGGASSGGTNSVDPAIAPSQCNGYWDFQGIADNKIIDTSGHNLPLTVSNASLVEGPRGNYLSLSGTNSAASAGAAVIDTTDSFSISVWVKLDQLGSYSTIVSQDGKSISSFYLQKRNSGRLSFVTFPQDSTEASACVTEGAIQPRAGEWYHVVATRNSSASEQRLYIDGILSGVSKCAGGFSSAGPLVVGRGRWDGEVDWTTGGVDELCVVDRVVTPTEAVDLYHQGRPTGGNYLFAYFAEQAQGRGDGLRLAQSHDALYWGAIGGGKVFLPPTVGGKSFRDPHVMRDPKGTYHVVWTTSCVPWAETGCVQDKGFGHAQSTDLVHFSEPQYVSIDLKVEHVWAPETFYDSESQQYMVYWSSPLDTSTAADPHSIYYVLTKDFTSFSKPEILYTRPGRNFIDATIIERSGAYLMFVKDEADGQKNIRALTSSTLYGASAWNTDPSTPLTGNYGAEGPSALLVGEQMYLFFDKYGDGKYGALSPKGLTNLTAPSSWQDVSSSVFFAGVRHGTPIEVPWDVYRAVALKAGE
ncbi:MAG: LamG-like jellyroll fold domain-containing protein [Myxococcales bacterium]